MFRDSSNPITLDRSDSVQERQCLSRSRQDFSRHRLIACRNDFCKRIVKHSEKTTWGKFALVLFMVTAELRGWPTPVANHELQGFQHTEWTSDDGLGAVFDVNQASDGFLWLTTSRGVLRFDGVRFETIERVTDGAIQNNDILSAFTPSSGGVWLSTRSAGLLFWNHGQLLTFPDRRCTPAGQVGGIVEDRDGALWIQATGGLSYFHGSTCEQIGPERGYSGGFPEGVFVDRAGTVWVKSQAGVLLFKPRGQSSFQPSNYVVNSHSGIVRLHENAGGSMWIADAGGLRPLTAGRTDFSRLHQQRIPAKVHDFTFAPDGSLWAVTDDGLRRFEAADYGRTTGALDMASGERLTPAQGLSSDAVWKVLIDRESNVWVGTNSGIDRLRRTALSKLVLPHMPEHEFAVAAGESRSVWLGIRSMPLMHAAADGAVTEFPTITSIASIRRDQSGVVWVASDDGPSLWRVSGKTFVRMPYPAGDRQAVVALEVDRNGDPWIYTLNGVTYQMRRGEWIHANAALGKKPAVLGAMVSDPDRNIWFAFSNRLVRWDGSTYQKYSLPNGPLNISPATMAARRDHVWLAGRGGVVLFTRGHFYLMRCQNAEFPGRVSGIVETQAGELWINGFSGVTHISATALAKWIQNPDSRVSAEHLDVLDGLPGYSGERLPEPSLVESPEGRLWFATTKGVAWLNPETLGQHQNRELPAVAISSVVVNGKAYGTWRDLSLPKYSENLEFNYTALSLAIPERVLFRYKLEPYDEEWQNAGTRRQAFYTHLPPGHYRMRVTACNNDGFWNESGATLSLALAPAFFQTEWFLALCFGSTLVLLWMAYRLRVRQLGSAMRARFDERLAERTRLARDLHDTFLQTIQGSKMVADDALEHSGDPLRTQRAMERLAEWLGQAVQEGRAALNSLRASSTETNDLASGFHRAIQDCVIQGSMEVAFSVKAEARDMHPIVRDEVYRIGYEAIRNASVHSGGTRLEVGIDYTPDFLRVRISDNGKGIDPVIAGRGKEGHYGLQGMRERAARIGATLSVTTTPATGTAIELTVPGQTVFIKRGSRL